MIASRIALYCLLLVATPLACAQMTYRWVDKATGQTVFSDQPPPPNASKVEARESRAQESSQLPYATRQAVERFPVTLYTSGNCGESCGSARALLNGRGVPYTEKLLNSGEEIAEISKQMGTDAFIPGIRVGTQNLAGFESGAWNNLLDLAGYPKSAPYGSKAPGASFR